MRMLLLLLVVITFGVLVEEAQQEEAQEKREEIKEERPPYDPTGKRDPFKPFIRLFGKRELTPQPTADLPPIKKYSLDQFRITGIVEVAGQSRAMVVDPEGNTYVLGNGDDIGNREGTIVDVREAGIMVEEKRYFEDVFGKKKVEVSRSVLAFGKEE